MGTKSVMAVELILDWSLWPRHEANGLDSTNVSRMRQALRAGISLPPVIVNAADLRVVDGFHRVRAHLLELGNEAKIRADLRVYETEADMFEDSVKHNAQHGLPLSPRDRAHVLIRARQFKIPHSTIALALGMTEASLKKFFDRKTAISPTGERVSIPQSARELAGQKLTEEQLHFVNTSDGGILEAKVSMLINGLNAEALKLTEKTVARLTELRDLITEVLRRASA